MNGRDFKYKQIIAVRTDLGMSKGKMAVQVAHGAVSAAERTRVSKQDVWKAWLREGQKKVAVKVQSEEEITDHATQWGNLQQGDLKYEDISGPEDEPDGVINSDDRDIIGNPFPEFSYSFNLGGSFSGFDLYVFFQGVHNVDRWNWYNTENLGTFTESILDYWTPENRNAAYWRMGNASNNTQRSTYYMTDASYLRVKNLEFGYTVPAELSRKIKLEKARIFFSGTNLLTWTDVTEFDPEKPAGDDRNRTYPSTKTYSLGVHLTF